MIRELAGLLHRRLIAAFMYSIEGFGAAWKSEEAIKDDPFFFLLFLLLLYQKFVLFLHLYL